jgi:hypothetical protein
MDLAAVKIRLAAPRCLLRLWRPASNAVFEFDIEAVQSAHRNQQHHHAQQQQQQYGKQNNYWQQEETGLM